MTIDIDVLNTPVASVYQMLVGLVSPRPIAWVTTRSAQGVINLAPFSFFNLFGANPPVVVISPTLKRDGTKKDTLLNIEANREFVIHASTESHAELINLTSKMLAPDESEVNLAGLSTTPSTKVSVPRLVGVPFSLECRVIDIVPVGNGPISANLVIGEVIMIHCDESILDASGQPDPKKLKSIARMGGENWCRTTDVFQLTRPS